MEIEPKTFQLVSLGCPKNLVDSEVMAGKLLQAGWSIAPEGPAQVCIINTCAFVTDAAQESVDILVEHTEKKADGFYQLLIATGCLPEKYRTEVAQAIGDIDAEIGAEDFPQIVGIIDGLLEGDGKRTHLSPHKYLYDHQTPRVLSGPPWRAFLKLAEGCDNNCSYCIIGRLRGTYRSRDFNSVIHEATNLAGMGVKELTLVAQDVTSFGADKDGAPGLADLITKLNNISGIKWIRLLYAHPAHLTRTILESMATAEKVVHYLDLPLQHASDPILKHMNRKTDKSKTEAILNKARELMPDILLRTTFITGLPGETEEDFEQLIQFVRKWRFANLGAFAYSPEEGTPAFDMEPKVPEDVALDRQDRLMRMQQDIAAGIWSEFVGKEVKVLIEEELHLEEDSKYSHVGRMYGQAADIDGVTFVVAKDNIKPGEFVTVRILDATHYDLFGETT